MKVKDSKTKELLKYLAIGGGIATVSLLAPMLPLHLLKAYMRERRFQRKLFLRDVKRLQERKLIDMEELPDKSVRMVLEKAGKRKVLEYRLADMQLPKPKQWDKKWRLVMFDIPDRYKKGRDALRYKMKELGFHRLQKSVFLHPFACEDEIDFVASVYEVRKYVMMIPVGRFEGEEKLKHLFQIRT